MALALAVALAAGAAEAAKAGSLKAGASEPAVEATTSAAGTLAGPVLDLDNDGARPALDLQVEAGKAL